MALYQQIPLCCPCGSLELFCRGLCRACYGGLRRSRTRFGGWREKILIRDHHRCRVCGARESLVVHHRWRRNVPAALITLCRGCHTRLHRLGAINRWVPETLRALWAEQHPGVPCQIQFPEFPAPRAAPDYGRGPRLRRRSAANTLPVPGHDSRSSEQDRGVLLLLPRQFSLSLAAPKPSRCLERKTNGGEKGAAQGSLRRASVFRPRSEDSSPGGLALGP